MLIATNGQIQRLEKFKNECGSDLFAFVSKVRRKMTALENYINESSRITGNVLIEVR